MKELKATEEEEEDGEVEEDGKEGRSSRWRRPWHMHKRTLPVSDTFEPLNPSPPPARPRPPRGLAFFFLRTFLAFARARSFVG
jgi:hypothetical protein